MSNQLTRMIREPLLQFLLIGAGVYALYFLYGEPPLEEQERTVLVTKDYVNSLSASFAKRWNRPPSDEEMLGLVKEYVRESLLYREGLAMGLDKDDHVIRRRLAQKLEFLTNDLVKLTPPDDSVLQQYLEENVEEFRDPDLLSFTQVYIDPDKRGAATLQYTESLLEQLQAEGKPGEDTFEMGDRFMLQSVFENVPGREIQRQMGQEFSDSVMQLDPGRWHGPVYSGYGIHLVYVSEHSTATDPQLADVRENLLNEYQHEQTQKFNEEFLEVLRSRYTVIIEAPLVGDHDFQLAEPTP